MRDTGQYDGKKITVVGLARSGVACANLLRKLGAVVRVTDSSAGVATRNSAALLAPDSIAVELGRHTEAFIDGSELVVISPGVPLDAAPVVWAREKGIPVASEIEVGWSLCPATVIAVTGSNGKTTTTTLISLVLKAAGKNAVACGNIGNPFTGELEKLAPQDFVCLEVSSFQLETIRRFRPKVSVMLNFNKNHLDRYPGMPEYLAAKKRIFMNQGAGDSLVVNADDPELVRAASEARAGVIFFRKKEGLNPNQSAVCAVASVFGVEEDTCRRVFSDFRGLEHRMELAAEIDGVKFINDSKATTAESCAWALNVLAGPVILICGGRDKGIDYSLIAGACRDKVKEIILIGEAAEKIASALSGACRIGRARSLEQAVEMAFRSARAGDTVLLSPMCSSYDMFTDYEHRGRVFKQAVLAANKP